MLQALVNRVQQTTDAHHAYLNAVDNAFHLDIDYAMLVKLYGAPTGESQTERKYSPNECNGTKKKIISGEPNRKFISTSYVERSNLSIRMGNRRFTRLTNAFSKKAENHAHAVSLMFFFYNYCRAHQTLTKAANGIKTTPAMAAGISDHAWTVEEMLSLLDPS